jgi:hypothetical protein
VKLKYSRQIFRQIFKYESSWKCVLCEPGCSIRTDRNTGTNDEADSSFSQFCDTRLIDVCLLFVIGLPSRSKGGANRAKSRVKRSRSQWIRAAVTGGTDIALATSYDHSDAGLSAHPTWPQPKCVLSILSQSLFSSTSKFHHLISAETPLLLFSTSPFLLSTFRYVMLVRQVHVLCQRTTNSSRHSRLYHMKHNPFWAADSRSADKLLGPLSWS